MSCPNNYKQHSDHAFDCMKKLPALRYAKEPVDILSRLYDKYPDGCEDGVYALVLEEDTFYRWNFNSKKWVPVGGGDLSSLLDLSGARAGDVLAWDSEKEKYTAATLSPWGETEW